MPIVRAGGLRTLRTRPGARPRARFLVAALAALTAVTSLTATAPADAALATTGPVTGVDISWPECPHTVGIPSRRGEDKPMPSASSQFVVVGLTNGPAFHRNPCIARQMRWVRNHHVWGAAYSVTTYPGPVQLARYGDAGPYRTASIYGRLRNVGWSQARFNVSTMKGNHIRTPFVWVDVEYYDLTPWTSDRHKNRAVVYGLVAGYRAAGYRVGVYSTQSMWADITGGQRYGLPEWRTAGQTSQTAALSKCGTAQIQGGRAVLAQWWSPTKDHDVVCPGQGPRILSRFFHRY